VFRILFRFPDPARVVGFARKLPIISGLLISTSIIGANFVESTPLVIAFLAWRSSAMVWLRSPGRWFPRWHRHVCWD
jgi:hypothetical protein